MYITRISILNFRPYRNSSVELSHNGGHIHIIEGPQGAGKTSLKTAIQWGLYGDTGTTNYREHWNRDAKDENDERMKVELEFTHNNREYQIKRSINRFDHGKRRARENLELIIKGSGIKTGSEAQNSIQSILPETLQQLYLLDGERIQNYFTGEEKISEKVLDEIETVLNHKPLINAEVDLQDKIDKYQKDRDKIEKEVSTRDSLTHEIKSLRNKKKNLENDLENKKESKTELTEELEQLNQKAAEQNEEVIEEINRIDSNINSLKVDRRESYDDLREIVSNLYLIEVSDSLDQTKEKIETQIQTLESKLEDAQRQKIFHNLITKAREGKCPICGNKEFKDPSVDHTELYQKEKLKEFESNRNDLVTKQEILGEVPIPEKSPKEVQKRIQNIQNDIESLEQERNSLMDELVNVDDIEDYRNIGNAIKDIRTEISEIDKDIGGLENEIASVNNKLRRKEDKRDELSNNDKLRELDKKISVAKSIIKKYQEIRNIHKKRTRDDIRDAMTSVFDKVTQSEFVSSKYKGLEFRGEVGEDEAFEIELVREDSKRKNMKNHPPSAGESQLAALSFVFGLNRYANYDSTVVFDTVAGRLDIENAQAQGEFFSQLNHPIILLVTDAELDLLNEAISESIGSYYQITLDDNINSKFKEVRK